MAPALFRIGCVSFLNARPLSWGLEALEGVQVTYRVPSALLEGLVGGEFDLALCPVIDFQTSPVPLEIVPAGGIGCDGPTLTVRLFSQVPVNEIHQVCVDGDSHTSIVLLQVLLRHLCGRPVEVRPMNSGPAQAMLLIGDKVVHSAPDARQYPVELDLGEAWKNLTGRPFVFAIWMCRAGSELGDLPERLARLREENRRKLQTIVQAGAAPAGWPEDLARTYLCDLLKFRTGPQELEAIRHFWQLAAHQGLIPALRPMRQHGLRESSEAPAV